MTRQQRLEKIAAELEAMRRIEAECQKLIAAECQKLIAAVSR